MKSKWSEMSIANKTMLLIRVLVSAAVLVCALLKLLGVWQDALHLAIPLLSVTILLQSVQDHIEKRKGAAILGYCCFVVMVILILATWFA